MATISSPGVGSGLDINSIISQLMAVERRPLTKLQQAASGVQTQLSVYGGVQSRLDTLASANTKLATASTWTQTTTEVSGSDALTATSSGSASPTTLKVDVTALARAQSTSSPAVATSATVVGTGTLTIQKAAWSGGTLGAGSSPVNITIDSSSNTLAGIRDKINAANAGVTASILTDSSGARLVLQSSSTGAANGFRVSVTDSDGGSSDATGLSMLGYDPPGNAQGTLNQAGSDLQATINGASVTSASNTLTDVIEGITLNVTNTTSATATVVVKRDLTAMNKAISEFVTAYGDLSTYLDQQTSYDAVNKKGQPLQGDRVAISLRSQLREAVIAATSATTAFSGQAGQASRLADIGITLQRDGKLAIDQTKLDKSLEKLSDVASLFSRVDASNSANQGVGTRLKTLVTALTGTDGAVTSRKAGLNGAIERNKDDQERMTDRLTLVEARLRRQYQGLDAKMGKLTGLGQYVSAQMTKLNNS